MNALRRGCSEFVVIWVIAGYVFYSYFQSRFEPPGDVWGSVGGGLLIAFAWGSVRNVFFAISRKSLLSQMSVNNRPEDGHVFAAVGPAVPIDEPLRSPIGDEACVAYGYHVYSRELVRYRGPSSSSTQIQQSYHMGGMAMCPFVIKTLAGDVRILGFAIPDAFPEKVVSAPQTRSRLLAYIAKTEFEEQRGLGIKQKLAEMKQILTDNAGEHRYDWKSNKLETMLDKSTTYASEQCLPVGSQVCVIGKYSEQHGGLINDLSAGGMEVFLGDIDNAVSAFQARIIRYAICVVLFIVAAMFVPYGVLTLRETRSVQIVLRNQDRFKDGIKQDDPAKVSNAIVRGISPKDPGSFIDEAFSNIRSQGMLDLLVRSGFDLNRHMYYGQTPLIHAVETRNRELARWLIEAGADVNARHYDWGFTALEKALDKGDPEMVQLLNSKQATADFVTKENGSPIAPEKNPELAAVNEYLRAFTTDDSAALREVTDKWPDNFFESFGRGLYRGSNACPPVFTQGFTTGEIATITMSCSTGGREEVWIYTLVRRDGKWKVRREALRERF